MKKLILVRHAQSGMHSPTHKDIDRTLDHQGRIDASAMAQRLKANSIIPDLFISSTAHRAIETAYFFLDAFSKDQTELLIQSKLYEPTVAGIYEVIEHIKNDCTTAIIFSHNPGITSFINDLLGNFPYSMPPCGMFAVNINTDHWNDIQVADKEFLFFDYPGSASK